MNFILIIISEAILIWSFIPHSSYSWGITPDHFCFKSKIDLKLANPSLFTPLSHYNSPDLNAKPKNDKVMLFELKISSPQYLEAKSSMHSSDSLENFDSSMLSSFYSQKWLLHSIGQNFYLAAVSSINKSKNPIQTSNFMLNLSINPFSREKVLHSNSYLSDFFDAFNNYFYYSLTIHAFMVLFIYAILSFTNRDFKLIFQLIILATLILQANSISCSSGSFSYEDLLCLSYCPTGYIENSSTNTCDYSFIVSLTITLNNNIILDQRGGINVGLSNTDAYPDYDANDPYPAYLRGYYFKSNSYLTTAFKLAPNFSIGMWIKALSGGMILLKPIPDYQWYVEILPSGYPKLSLLLSDSFTTISVTGTSSVLNGWYFISFDGSINADGTTTISSYIDGTFLDSFTTASALYISDSFSGNLFIGLSNDGFTGFITRLRIYSRNNHHLDDWQTTGCSAPCTKCSADLSCPSDCPLNKYIDGSSCSACMNMCNKGCVSPDSCRLCKTKECGTCSTFTGGNSCLTCIPNAISDGSGGCTCAADAFWLSLIQSCELCDSACPTCLKTTYFECSACLGTYKLVGNLCLNGCPFGFGTSCSPVITPVIDLSFNVDFQGSYGIFTTGANSAYFQHFNTPETIDPIPAYKRGLYFDGNMYLLSSSDVLLYHSFSIGVWLYVITDGGILEKQTRFILTSKGSITAIMENPSATAATKTLSLGTTLIDWNYLSVTIKYNSGDTTITVYINNALVSTLAVSNYIYRDLASTNLMLGKSSSSGFVGFISSFQLWNAPISSFSSYINDMCGSGHSCLWSCDLFHYYSENSQLPCNSCSKGCVRAETCNICDDLLCSVCTGFGSGKCTQCVTNASGTPCACISGYSISSDGFSCILILCSGGCSHCTDTAYYKCTACNSGYYFLALTGQCLNDCPSGYSKNPSTNVCVFIQEKIFDLDLNTLNGVIYDKASSIPVITGSASQFYPNYEADDPIPAYLRGFYFNGQSSVLRLPEYSNYSSPILVMAPVFTISIWLNSESTSSALISKQNIYDNYSTLYLISLIGGKPTISLIINSSTFYYTCQTTINNYEWSHISFTLKMNNGHSVLSSYINGISDFSAIAGYGAFIDISTHTTMAIGAQIGLSAVYNFYQGFIYTIQIFNVEKSISSLSTVSCTESCNVCPINQVCIPNCKINEYWSGPAYNLCYHCNTKCEKSCRDWRNTCSLCNNLLCDDCDDYSSCKTCKEHAIDLDSCKCDDNYVLDKVSSNTCIPIGPGGFKGDDGYFYSCPNLCTACESLIKCTSCVSNASLKNGLCYCSLGFSGTSNCILVPFSAKLTVLADNSLYLTFSDSLAKHLTASSFIIIIENHGEVSSKLEKMNNTCYYISLEITEKISQGTLALLQFLDLSEIISISNGILNSSEISAQLNSYDPNSYSPVTESVASQSKTTSQTVISVMASLSILNSSPSSLWSIMNTLQILSYLTLSGIPFSSEMRSFLNNLNSFNLFPNAFEYFIDENEGNPPYSQAQDFGFDTDLVLLNQGNDFMLIFASIAILPAVLYFSRCSHKWIGKKFRKTLKDYQYAFYLRFWIQCYLELGAAASIGLLNFEFKNTTQITNLIICLTLCILLFITPIAYLWFSYKNKNQIQTREKIFFSLFNTFFYEFRTDRRFITTQYYFLFFARRLIYIVNLVYLRNYPQTEVTINIVLSFLTVIYLAFYWPFEDVILQITNLATELLILLVMSSTVVYLFSLEKDAIAGVESCIILIVLAIIAIQAVSSLIIFGKTLYHVIKQKLLKAGITKENNHPDARIRKIQI